MATWSISEAATSLIRYAVRYYEHTSFFGRESDADVVITPSMALVMPGQPWIWTGEPWDRGASIHDIAAAIELDAAANNSDGFVLDPELGPPGAPQPPKPDAEPK